MSYAKEAILTKREVVELTPDFLIASGSWGKFIYNHDLGAKFLLDKTGKELTDGLSFLRSTGITGRHHPEKTTPFLENRPQISKEMVRAGTEITKASMRAIGWRQADHIIFSSSTPGDEKGEWGEEIARNCNIGSWGFSLAACDGAIAGCFDVLNRPELADQRVVITAVEPLGYLVNPTNFKDATIFGNGTAALSFRPNRVSFYNGKTLILPDKKGVICSPKTYGLPAEGAAETLPDYLQLAAGADQVFFYGNNKTILILPEVKDGSDPNFLTMDGLQTAMLFGREVPKITTEVLSRYYLDHPDFLDNPDSIISLCVSHQPSAGVLDIIARRLNNALGQLGLPTIKIPWVMRGLGMGNASSAVSLIAMAELAKQGKIEPNKPFNQTAYGIGSALTSMNIALKAAS